MRGRSQFSAFCIVSTADLFLKQQQEFGKSIFPNIFRGDSQEEGPRRWHFYRSGLLKMRFHRDQFVVALDLIKAFNTFGRFAVACLMIRLGMPHVLVHARIQSLSDMVRFPTLSTHVGTGISSTIGVPEGCSISVLAMMATACFYYYRVASSMVSPYAYADNWSWCSKSQRERLQAYHRMQETVDLLRLHLDYNKSWHWATSKPFRKACEDFQLGFIKDKIAEATARIRRVEWLPASLQKKAVFIQTACWPLALYGSETTYIGQQHYVLGLWWMLWQGIGAQLLPFWHVHCFPMY